MGTGGVCEDGGVAELEEGMVVGMLLVLSGRRRGGGVGGGRMVAG